MERANSINDLVQYGDRIYYSGYEKNAVRSFDGGKIWTELSNPKNPVNLTNLTITKEYILATNKRWCCVYSAAWIGYPGPFSE